MDAVRKVAVVTGASSGIGSVYADRFAARGYDLLLVARRVDRLNSLATELEQKFGITALTHQADLANPDDLAGLEAALATDCRVAILVNNAGLSRLAPFADAPISDPLEMIAVHITALTRLTRAVLPVMIARDQGTIINIASALAVHSLAISSVYSGTKSYVMNFTRGLQEEVSGTNTKVQLVLPASTATEIWDSSGIPLAALDQETVMPTEVMVDAALAGLDGGELITWPSVHDVETWGEYDAARAKLFAATQVGEPAPRYQ